MTPPPPPGYHPRPGKRSWTRKRDGSFHAIYALFLGTFSGTSAGASGAGPKRLILYSAAIFFARYLIDFIRSRGAGRKDIPNLGALMFAPYPRIVPMHLTIILGGFVGAVGSFSTGTNLIILVIFAAIKTVVELFTEAAVTRR